MNEESIHVNGTGSFFTRLAPPCPLCPLWLIPPFRGFLPSRGSPLRQDTAASAGLLIPARKLCCTPKTNRIVARFREMSYNWCGRRHTASGRGGSPFL